jgi:phosphoribosyl 1,2-cyclic phosphate phosphodiesterase
MKVTLLGTGDSAGVPQIGCGCDTCSDYAERGDQRTRFSVLVEHAGERLLIDTSPDLRSQFLREDLTAVDHVLYTHAHYDHYAGLGDLYRVIWRDLPIYGTEDVLEYVVEDRYAYLPFPEPRPVEPHEPFDVGDLTVELVPVHHPPADCYGIVLRSDDATVAITSDTGTAIPEASRDAFRGADLLVADAFIPGDREYGDFVESRMSDDRHDFADKHMTYEGAEALVEELAPDEAVFVHCSHFFREDRELLGRDGQTFEF